MCTSNDIACRVNATFEINPLRKADHGLYRATVNDDVGSPKIVRGVLPDDHVVAMDALGRDDRRSR